MDKLSSDVVQDFSAMILGEKQVEKPKTIYGYVVERNGEKYVQIDGSDLLTPMNVAVEVEDGDRVLLQLEHREVIAIGNITSPASARTAKNFMKLTENGLMVGKLDEEGVPEGSYTLMNWDRFLICDKNGRVLASFDSSEINFGNKATFGEDGVTLRDGEGRVIATFKRDGVNFDNKAVFNTDGVELKDGSNNTIAKFTKDSISFMGKAVFGQNGVVFYDQSGNVISEISSDAIKLGKVNATIELGKDAIGNAICKIGTDNISFNANVVSLSSKKQLNLYAYKNSLNYSVLSMGFDDNIDQTPRFQLWGYANGYQNWDMTLNKDGVWFGNYHGSNRLYMNNKLVGLDEWYYRKEDSNLRYPTFSYIEEEYTTKKYVNDNVSNLKDDIFTLEARIKALEER